VRIISWVSMLILILCSGCSSITIEDAETVRLDYWSGEVTEEIREEYIDENNGLDYFVNAVNAAEEVTEQSVITTRPLLSLEFVMEDKENRNYHLWVTDRGEGFIQSLQPHKSLTFRLDPDSVKELKGFFETKESVEVLKGKIEFEQ